jgi:capsular polysaccharide export protein
MIDDSSREGWPSATPAAAAAEARRAVGITSAGMQRIPFLEVFLRAPVRRVRHAAGTGLQAVAGWGRKRSGRQAAALAASAGLPCMLLEDGFLRSWGTGDRFPPLAIVADDTGIYYDSTAPSALERLLASDADVLGPIRDQVLRARSLLLRHGLSKYNHAPELDPQVLRAGDTQRVLVVDQTFGDLSVGLGGANADTFLAMLAAARAENPQATIYVKTHPEVSAGRKSGYLATQQDDERTVVVRHPVQPHSLLRHMDRVYVVSSIMGFEALLAGKAVSCFGLPWYAGWGATDDRQSVERRGRRRSVDELFAAAYFHYTRYLDPVTRGPGTIFDAIGWLFRQQAMGSRPPAAAGRSLPRLICVGFRRWKAANLKPMLALDPARVIFVRTAARAAALQPGPEDSLVFWGGFPPDGLAELARRCGARLVRMEDGFIRSVGLGSDLIRPLSLVLDADGIYFDPSRPSGLENLLNTADFEPEETARAQAVRGFIVEHGLTKYNMEPRRPARWPAGGRRVLLVPGQVEDDASIRLGCGEVRTNLGLLEAARRCCPDAFIVYKPHPDVTSGNRAGRVALAGARRFADHVETGLSVVSCIEACDEVHTMTSLTGFDALLRGKKVVTYGQPFYAGWGLTEDRMQAGAALARRGRRLTLDELVAGTLLRYPHYWDWELRGYTTCEAVLRRIVESRNAQEASGGLERLRVGFLRRQARKLRVLARAWLAQ